MNQRTAKFLRKLLGVENEDPTTKKIYRRFKRDYTKLPSNDRKEFLERLELLHKQYNK
tara:strand:+ start:17399 stop:17572 length:174 start_codon:yes stop_codon:yes gene_type:complete